MRVDVLHEREHQKTRDMTRRYQVICSTDILVYVHKDASLKGGAFKSGRDR